jgi:hypothetical protein
MKGSKKWTMPPNLEAQSTTIRLSGRKRTKYLEELKAEIQDCGTKIKLDLDDVNLVGVEIVRFLGICQVEGAELLHCPPYIRRWITREQDREK